MLRNFFYSMAALLCTTANLTADIETKTILQAKDTGKFVPAYITIPFPDSDKQWQLAFSNITSEFAVFEWLLLNDNLEQWSKLIQIQFFKYSDPNLKEQALVLAERFCTTLKQTLSSAEINFIRTSKPSDVMFEWHIEAENSYDAQHEICRMITTKDGLFRLVYTVKASPIPSNLRSLWVERLKKARLVLRK